MSERNEKFYSARNGASERAEQEKVYARHKELCTTLTRLVANEDFKCWFQYIDFVLSGTSFGPVEISPFIQGKRAAIDLMRKSLAIADGGPEFVAELTRKHFAAVALARHEAAKPQTENT